MVLLHGLAGSATEMAPTMEALDGCTVVALDQRGHGHSTRRPADLSRSACAQDVAAVAEGLLEAPVALVGESMGRTPRCSPPPAGPTSSHPLSCSKVASVVTTATTRAGEVERMLALRPGAGHAVIPGAGHDAHLDNPAEWFRVLKAFLAPAFVPNRA